MSERSEVSEATQAILLDAVSFSYNGEPAVEDLEIRVAEGRFAALIGPNGAGKSTCLRLILGLLAPDRGRVRVFGSPAGSRSVRVGYVPQKTRVPEGFPLTVQEMALMGRFARIGIGRRPRPEDRERAREALARVGLGNQEDRLFHDLSGGQQQRALIARALTGDPRLLLLDEPTAGLDPAARAAFYQLLCELQQDTGVTVLASSHHIQDVAVHADTLIVLDRRILAVGSPEEIASADAIDRAYEFPHLHDHPRRRNRGEEGSGE